jgi:hypothetical protein
MKVECEVNYEELEGEHGPIDGVIVTCGKCGHEVQSFGTGGASVRRCLAMLRNNCPRNEDNYYIADDGSDEE